MLHPVELTTLQPTPTAVVRSCVPRNNLSKFVPKACGEVWTFIRAANLPKPGRHVAIYLDNHGTVEVGAEVSQPFTGSDRIICSQLPSGRAATTAHFGPYPRLLEAHTRIREWCAKHGHQLTGVSCEIYGHWDQSWNSDPSKIRTDVFYQLKNQSA